MFRRLLTLPVFCTPKEEKSLGLKLSSIGYHDCNYLSIKISEYFLLRGLQICLPGFNVNDSFHFISHSKSVDLTLPPNTTRGLASIACYASSITFCFTGKKMTTNAIVLFLMNYAHFVVKAKANIEMASTLYQKALQVLFLYNIEICFLLFFEKNTAAVSVG